MTNKVGFTFDPYRRLLRHIASLRAGTQLTDATDNKQKILLGVNNHSVSVTRTVSSITGLTTSIRVESATYTIDASDCTVIGDPDSAAANIVFFLPPVASVPGGVFIVGSKDFNASSAFGVSVESDGPGLDAINGAFAVSIVIPAGQFKIFQSDGTEWYCMPFA